MRLTFFQLLSRTKAMVPFYIIPAYKKLLPVQTINNGFKDLNELNQNLLFFYSGVGNCTDVTEITNDQRLHHEGVAFFTRYS